eukprot:CAMPEP_0114612144 /NCGR_PEP_ID=MMETSP0168-20121206/4473_1 /TAXON_ID=95228 ORGANISM="Vannella sp., Strain DIVA3 517/6/12" /NCGR_SAMPLE_ID=MMETSP0168 /ASSEMBLY_ACC=CAM_ASM_000044 /LENGTH=152 /DNA_ID=CAMNT_0001823125 /DNA_START=73 /DNA_END=531 /DNA_ORIENTATION=+
MKVEICHYSGFRIHPGHGKKFVRNDSKQFNFITKKAERQFLNKNNPRKIAWTMVYRKMHKKGLVEEVRKKRSRKAQKVTKAIVGASLAFINEKRVTTKDTKAAAAKAKEARAKRKADKAAKIKAKKAHQKEQRKAQAAPSAPKGRSHAGKGR